MTSSYAHICLMRAGNIYTLQCLPKNMQPYEYRSRLLFVENSNYLIYAHPYTKNRSWLLTYGIQLANA